MKTYWREEREKRDRLGTPATKTSPSSASIPTVGGRRQAPVRRTLEGLLVTDAYAAYNSIEVRGRQSCLAHLLRTAREIRQVLAEMKMPDTRSARFCIRLTRLLKLACAIAIPAGHQAREKLIARLHRILNRVCANPLAYQKAETLRKRLIPARANTLKYSPSSVSTVPPPTITPNAPSARWSSSAKSAWAPGANKAPGTPSFSTV